MTYPLHEHTVSATGGVITPEPEKTTMPVSTTNHAVVLDIDGLDVTYSGGSGAHHAVRGVSFTVEARASVGLVGESGSGKSTILRAVSQLLPSTATVTGTVRFQGRDVYSLSSRAVRDIRGGGIAIVFQDPVNALNPALRVGAQLSRILRLHRPEIKRRDRDAEVVAMLRKVGIDPDKRRNYPFEFSQGQLQRVMIAWACLAGQPVVVLADEPTTSLDVTVEAQVLDLLRELRDSLGLALVLVTHDLALVHEMCEKVVVLYAGTVVEELPAEHMLASAAHPYTELLIGAIPPFPSTGGMLQTVPPPTRTEPEPGAGCVFASRCPKHLGSICDTVTPAAVPGPVAGQTVRCHIYGAGS